MPLLERARVEVYVPDLPSPYYRHLLLSFEEEFTYAFGGCTILRELDGSFLSRAGAKTPDQINLILRRPPNGPINKLRQGCSLRRRTEKGSIRGLE